MAMSIAFLILGIALNAIVIYCVKPESRGIAREFSIDMNKFYSDICAQLDANTKRIDSLYAGQTASIINIH